MTYAEVVAKCEALGARLCAFEEMDCTKGTGCGHEADLLWSSKRGDVQLAAKAVDMHSAAETTEPAARGW